MSDGAERIGVLVAEGLDLYRAQCDKCSWNWAGERDKAVKALRGHSGLVHPPPIIIYREPS